jgi:hypothetical protein
MGLDIAVFRNIELDPHGDPYTQPDTFVAFIHPSFPEQGEGLTDGGVYRSNDEMYRFRAGSYSGYNAWREMLCEMVYDALPIILWEHPDEFKGEPFYELINFADNEGAIGPIVSAKLAKDFADYQAKADQHEDEFFRDLYSKWRTAFEMASENGVVIFC